MKKVEMTKEQAIVKAQEIRNLYPHLNDVQSVINQAKEDNVLTDETETLIVWGRLMRLLPAVK
jgi:hypothetical protein